MTAMFDLEQSAAAEAQAPAQTPALSVDRMRGLARRAAEIVAPVWPLETFIACNPLLGLEDLPFERAVAEGERLFGGRGHPTVAAFAADLKAGRIDPAALDAALAARADLEAVATLGDRRVSLRDLARAQIDAGVDLAEPSAVPAAAPALAVAQAVKWCVAVAGGGAAWAAPGRERGLWACWRALAPHDAELTAALGHVGAARLAALPADPDAALAAALSALGAADPEAAVARMRAALARVAGWAGFFKWAEANPADWRGAPLDVLDLLAVFLTVEALAGGAEAQAPAAEPTLPDALLEAVGVDPAASGAEARRAVALRLSAAQPAIRQACLEAAEESFRADLLGRLSAAAPRPVPARVAAQAVFCIDVRSEPFRRALEAQAPVATYGYAGFFGLPLRHAAFDGPERSLCPVLLSPSHRTADAPRAGAFAAARTAADKGARLRDLGRAFDGAKRDLAAPFALAEATGLLSGAAMVARTVAPRWTGRLVARLKGSTADAFAPDLSCGHGGGGLTLEAKAFYAQAMFAFTGMGAPTARLFAVIGHGGQTVNNAYGSALDCGACGGSAGGPSAKAMAAILNDADVRAKLAEAGIGIPEDCWAIAGQHDTTTDVVTLYARDAVPESHRADLAAFEAALAAAGRTNRAARAATLPRAADPETAMFARAADWAEVRPEWALAGCAAFIVGPRRLTEGADLGGRAFLHSYDWTTDADAKALTVILTAPMVVAEWISTTYYFSTVDPEAWGAGDKATQNVVPGVGVMQGAESDLKRGLPLQSTHDDAGRPRHQPLRLTTVVEAPVERVEQVIAANPVLRKLFGGGWVALVVLDPVTGDRQRRREDGAWVPAPATAPSANPTPAIGAAA
jgi:uncharacterized protein YbcC (UPF0753/DUF2309 family)